MEDNRLGMRSLRRINNSLIELYNLKGRLKEKENQMMMMTMEMRKMIMMRKMIEKTETLQEIENANITVNDLGTVPDDEYAVLLQLTTKNSIKAYRSK
ncbi:unnamed protein product [Sphenostylis stenocarpa]|uniref:Uncharacterized protein n=1 Tax=Sphenostylis stenocarpa TaxID=92480 RepID=A0AA86SVD8_9FABA|nr:unnamed protein product [Sphenostylis stenocarpa]